MSCSTGQTDAPNIILILADDLGYGDVQSYNRESEIPTPNINKLSEEGIMFTDAHTPSSICTPTRYGLLTGRYCWRSSLKRGVLKGYDPPLIEENRITVADYLKGMGYHTGIVGKWHLGLGFQKSDTGDGEPEDRFDLTKTLTISPNDNGFDYSFVHPASLDFDPYVYVKNRQVVDTEFDTISEKPYPYSWSEGLKSKSLKFDEVLDDLLFEAKEYIKREAKSEEPFFLYFPLTAPHVPVLPEDRFMGTSGKGWYGDFIIQVDWTAGEIFKLLEELNIVDNTLLIFTSDNGSPMRTIYSSNGPDAVTDESLRYYNAVNHKSNAMLRGIKGDTYEGGHRVPFIVRWPEKLPGGKQVDETICLTDMFQTLVEATGGKLPEESAEDSYSFFPILSGEKVTFDRPPVIHHSGGKGMFAIRKGGWKLILGNGSGARTQPVGSPFRKPYQLFNIENDISESENLIDSKKEVAKSLERDFYDINSDKDGNW
jgi:arylsulfatase A-like enzyme